MKTFIITLLALLAFGCNSAPRPVADGSNAAAAGTPERSQTAIAHSSENQTPPPATTEGGPKSKWTQGGDAIDTAELDAGVSSAEAALAKKPGDDAAKKALGAAFYKRAMALTDARQYAAALGDFRRAVKNDPSNEDAKGWVDKIIMIYDSINRDYPKEGEEPPALPFKKGK